MGVTPADVLAAADLRLRLISGQGEALNREIRWVAVTELADPRPFLDGGELILTTGLRQRTATAQRQFVERIAERDVAALGFGSGLSHTSIPAATLTEATRHGMVLFEVPYETPFIAIDRFVADRIFEEHYDDVLDLVEKNDQLAQVLLSEQGLDGMARSLRTITGADIAVIDRHGNVLAATRRGSDWPVERILAEPVAGHGTTVAGLTVLPLEVQGTDVARLCVTAPQRSAHILPYARTLVGLELARRQAVLDGRRLLAGQVLDDVVAGAITAAQATRRLTAVGIQPTEKHALVIGQTAGHDPARLIGSPFPLSRATAVLRGCLVVVLRDGQSPDDAAEVMQAHLRRPGADTSVGIGGWHAGVSGLRWSYFEAREAMAHGPGIHQRLPLSLSGLIMASEDVPIRDLAEELLRPLLTFDAERGADLVKTLRTYFDLDASVAATAERLTVHRNTVRYRLTQVEQLTGRSLQKASDQVQLWLALSALRPSGPA